MPKIATRLTDKAVMNAKPDSKPRKLFDGEGLFLLVKPDGGKYWRLKFRFGGKEKLLALRVYPTLTLAAARIEAGKARQLLTNGIDPTAERRANKEAVEAESQILHNTFERVALEWYEFKRANWAPATIRKAEEALRIDLLPAIGSRPIAELTSPEVVKALQAVEKRCPHMADKARQYCGSIVRYAIRTGKREDGRFLDLRDVLKPLKEARPATLEAKDLPAFLKALRTLGYQGKVTPHRFRTMASTLLNEMGFESDWIERQLAHKETNKIRAAYNRAQYMTERRKMMQHWADYLDGMATGGKVHTLKSKAA
jgi:hypothetical protein